jgi:single-strand DNA-binding protein
MAVWRSALRGQLPQVSGTGTEGEETMNETTLTITGNLVDDPELRFTPSGQPVAKFRIASTPRYFDKATNAWKDGDTLFLTVNVWRQVAENVAESMTRGTRAIVTGRLRQRTWETKEGEKRTSYEIEADEVAVSLRNATAKVSKVTRASAGNSGQGQGDPWAGESASGYTEEPPF